MKKSIIPMVLLSLGVLTSQTSEAAILNGGFESNFSDWNTGGIYSIETGDFNVDPTEPTNQALLTTAEGSLLTDIGGGLEDFLGVELGIFSDPDNFFSGTATEGSAIWQDFSAQGGETLRFDWNFLTSDPNGQDYAFVVLAEVSNLGSLSYGDLPKLSSANRLVSSNSDFDNETGYRGFSYTIPSTGTYRLGIGVVDVPDTDFDSGVLVDNIRLEAIPEPLTILGSGLVLGFGIMAKKTSKKN